MLYAYCVVDEPVQIAEQATGIAGGEIRAIETNGLIALASEFVGDTVPFKAENVMKHDELVGAVLAKTTPLPFRFGTLVKTAQLENFLEQRGNALRIKLDEVRDCVEMSVKVIWTPETPAIRESEPADTSLRPGAAFLRAKRREILGDEALVNAARALKSWLHDRLSHLVRGEEILLRPSQKLVLVASHLVKKTQVGSYQDAMKRAVEDRSDLHFLVSGPWAPYSFVNIDLEFKTQSE